MDRNETINAILKVARRPCPKIVPSIKLQGSDGGWYGCNGFPSGVEMTGEKRITGYVYQNNDGTRYGRGFTSEDEASAAFSAHEDKHMDDLRAALAEKSDSDLAESAEYWMNRGNSVRA